MAFALKPDRPIRRELERLVGRQLKRASQEIQGEPAEEQVHDARKRIKKARAILRLLDEAPKARRFDAAERKLQKTGRALSTLRDADVMRQTFDRLHDRCPRRPSEHTCALIRRRLDELKSCAESLARRNQVVARASERLRRMNRSSNEWQFPRLDADDFARLLDTAYRRARKAMRRAADGETAADAHRWRRRSKTLRYQLQLASDMSPRVRSQVRDLKKLDTVLGDDHNLDVLATTLAGEAALPDAANGVSDVIATARSEQRRLRADAFTLGRRLFREPPKQFLRRMRRELTAPRGRGLARRSGRAAA